MDKTIMKLYEVPRKSYIMLEGNQYWFDHIDGMYSFCHDMKGNIVHLAAWTEVEVVEECEGGG
jgi:hypothetical protein